jgi:hypothetical protein
LRDLERRCQPSPARWEADPHRRWWIAAVARQWRLPLATTDVRDYAAIDDLEIVPIQ